ncbi:MAG: polymerase, sigma 28 subunit, FliA/WhiG subfamily, partial [Myxococcaceae bacterium]|nr:polymerase, sigma 28 subunit, FliA/WhiG subfamily [Myxococcaceae bacterium]
MTFTDSSISSSACSDDSAPARSIAPAPAAQLTDAVARKYAVRVMAHARRYARRLPPHITMGDMISAGMLGLVEGYQRYDASRAETLDAFLDHRIRGAMLDELRRHDPLTRAQRAFVRSAARATRDAERDGGATEEGLATTLGMSVGDLRERAAQAATARAMQATGEGPEADAVPD